MDVAQPIVGRAESSEATSASARTVGRLSLYRRLLYGLIEAKAENVYSHDLARIAGVTAAQVRRDIMALGHSGSPVHGYNVRDLIDAIGLVLDAEGGQCAALVGVGNLGRAIIAYFASRRPRLGIVAGFDSDPGKVDRVIHGCHCYPVAELGRVVREHGVGVGIVTVPAEQAQQVAELLVAAGVRGLLNFAPVRLTVSPEVYVEDVDITTSLERVAYFARGDAATRRRDSRL